MVEHNTVGDIDMWSSKDLLRRLELYRKNNNIIQSDMAQVLGMTQDRYSYVENGSTKLTGDCLVKLAEYGFDIDYIITGQNYECKVDSIDKTIASFKTEADRDFVLRMLAEIIVKKIMAYTREFSAEE